VNERSFLRAATSPLLSSEDPSSLPMHPATPADGRPENIAAAWPPLAGEVQEANDRCAGILEIRSTADGERGWGLFALRSFLQDQLVMASRGTDLPRQTSHSIQTGWDRHVHMDLPARFVNHTCGSANVGIRLNQNQPTPSYDFYALRPIEAGDELLWDYECSEYEISDFVCRCGAETCRGTLKGFKHRKDEILKAYGCKYVAPYLLEPRQGPQEDVSSFMSAEEAGGVSTETDSDTP
jgi:uncharacterized protein